MYISIEGCILLVTGLGDKPIGCVPLAYLGPGAADSWVCLRWRISMRQSRALDKAVKTAQTVNHRNDRRKAEYTGSFDPQNRAATCGTGDETQPYLRDNLRHKLTSYAPLLSDDTIKVGSVLLIASVTADNSQSQEYKAELCIAKEL